MKALIEQLLVLRDLAPADIPQTRADRDELDRRRFYIAVYEALPALCARVLAADAPRQDLNVEHFRRIRRVVLAAQAWAGRTPDNAEDLARDLEIACAALTAD